MIVLLIAVFIVGYLLISLEEPLKLNKAASALLTGVVCWVIFIISSNEKDNVTENLYHHLSEISGVLFFLLGAMTIVELIDSHDGFKIITRKTKTRSKAKLLWITALLTFVLSSLLDNLTTTIVMTSFVGKVLSKKIDRLWFTSIIIIAANAGGAFSPLGDITTTMLWINGQITAQNIIVQLFLPSIAVCLVPLLIITPKFKNQTFEMTYEERNSNLTPKESNFVLILGVFLLLFVPVFKIVTHLPPFMGMLFSLSIFWIIISIIHFRKTFEEKKRFSVTYALQKIDTESVLFFLGILLAVSALQSVGVLKDIANTLDETFGNVYIIGVVLGLVSAIVDNVPLVSAAQGMYDLSVFPTDHVFWEFLALTTGTGGSAIIIGSSSGVAAMGIEKIDFIWYLKNISLLAIAGFLAGVLVFILQAEYMHF
ncbi:MAG: sodium:proton antiporter NhaD [Chitinophagaceae bacterium]|nr:sodium:proton antiporter NhaD [Chitinophagaceae bacterium]